MNPPQTEKPQYEEPWVVEVSGAEARELIRQYLNEEHKNEVVKRICKYDAVHGPR